MFKNKAQQVLSIMFTENLSKLHQANGLLVHWEQE